MRSAALGLTLLASLAGCRPQATPELSSADAAAVRANIDAYASAALAGDWDAWGKTLADDVVYMPPNQAPLLGRDAAVSFGKSFPKITSLTITPEDVTGRADLAYARGKYSYAATLPDGSAVSESGSFLEIHRRQADGTWLHSQVMWHADSPPPPAPAPVPGTSP